MNSLVKPSIRYKKSYLEYLDESGDNKGLHRYVNSDLVRNDFEKFVSILNDQYEQKQAFPDFVPFDLFWLVDGDQYLGRINFRYYLDAPLEKAIGGHIGYDIRESEWNKGYGSQILKLGLEKVEIPREKFIVTCNEDNIASYKIIEKNDSVFLGKKEDDQNKYKLEYEIKNSNYAPLRDWSKELSSIEGWHFGGKGSGFENKLVDLVTRGIKTATCSWYEMFEVENEPIPKVGEYSYIMDSSDRSICVIETTNIEIKKFNEVDEHFAFLEGEGDRSYQYWRRVHEEFFSKSGKEAGIIWDSNKHSVVCEQFKLIHLF